MKLAFDEEETFGDAQLIRFKIGGADEPEAPIKMSRFRLAPGVITPWDEHAAREVWVVETGSGRLETNGTSTDLSGGEAYYIASNRPHRITNIGEGQLSIISIWWP